MVFEPLLVNSWKWLHLNRKLQRKQVNGLSLPWILFHELLSHTPLCISKWKGTKEMQVATMTCIDKRGLWVTRHNITETRGRKYVSRFPYPTELNIADSHAYYICSCKHAHLEYFIILNASVTDYMLFQASNERRESRATAIYGRHCCVTSVLLLEVMFYKVVRNVRVVAQCQESNHNGVI